MKSLRNNKMILEKIDWNIIETILLIKTDEKLNFLESVEFLKKDIRACGNPNWSFKECTKHYIQGLGILANDFMIYYPDAEELLKDAKIKVDEVDLFEVMQELQELTADRIDTAVKNYINENL